MSPSVKDSFSKLSPLLHKVLSCVRKQHMWGDVGIAVAAWILTSYFETCVINIGGPLVDDWYKFESRKKVQKGLTPALIKTTKMLQLKIERR